MSPLGARLNLKGSMTSPPNNLLCPAISLELLEVLSHTGWSASHNRMTEICANGKAAYAAYANGKAAGCPQQVPLKSRPCRERVICWRNYLSILTTGHLSTSIYRSKQAHVMCSKQEGINKFPWCNLHWNMMRSYIDRANP
jgi:hypothetical protein